ncbi:MAG: hypothetical protein WBQ72_12965 [Terriglobales bacterium]
MTAYKSPVELVRKAAHHEIEASEGSAVHFMYRGVTTSSKGGSVSKLYVETKDGTASLTVAQDGKPLTPDQQQAEQARLDRFVNHPDELRKKRNQDREDNDRTARIMRALPDAFFYEYAGEEKGSAGIGRAGDPLVNLRFRPNPSYHPPSRVEEVLTGMQGHILVDTVHDRIASIDGTLFKDVGFGWGILGRLNRGGHFLVHQVDVGDDQWEISSMTVNFTGKIMLIKNFSIQSTEEYSGFRQISPSLTFAEGVRLLKKEETTAAEVPATTSSLAQR